MEKKKWRKELDILKELHGYQKLQHIFSYYRLPVILFLLLLFFIFVLVSNYEKTAVLPRLYVSLFSSTTTDYTGWADQRMEQLPSGDEPVEWIQSTYFTHPSYTSAVDKNYISTRIGAKEMDVIISTAPLYEYMLDLNCVLPLDKLFEGTGQGRSEYGDNRNAVRLTPAQFPATRQETYYLYVCSLTEHRAAAARMFQAIVQHNRR